MKSTDSPIIIEQNFNASKNDLWKAITVCDEMIQWFFPNIPSFKPVVGFETGFIVEVDDTKFPHLWKIVEVFPMKKIAYEWKYEGYPGSAIVSFELFGDSDRATNLLLSFKVIKSFPDSIPEFKRESCVEGWDYFIKNNLKEYIEKKKLY